MVTVTHVECQTERGSCDAECQTERETNLESYRERNYEKEQESIAVTHVECQTKPIGNLRVADHELLIRKEEESIENCHKVRPNLIPRKSLKRQVARNITLNRLGKFL